ncbi:hypothetical protein R3P38DRAFT_3169553 [Favolaschia claudopus]|uniref:CCHC-type domain-containing protein n=1 Tax=Favolaschia claudopus TaxID=2862362 RepID=A0AAW0E2X6_9AGAR
MRTPTSTITTIAQHVIQVETQSTRDAAAAETVPQNAKSNQPVCAYCGQRGGAHPAWCPYR